MVLRERQTLASISLKMQRLCILLVSTVVFIGSGTAQQNPLYHFCQYEKGNFSDGSQYSANLNRLITSVATLKSNDYGFYNYSLGGNSGEDDRSNAVALCRGDIKPNACVQCIRNASVEIRQRCPDQKTAVIWYDNCMFRYSNTSILGVKDASPAFYMWNRNNLTDKAGFERTLRGLLESLRERAAAGGPRMKYASGSANSTAFVTAYAFVQCTPDLSEPDCSSCLVESFSNIPRCCDGKQGGRWINPSCNFRYEIYPFLESAADQGPPRAPSPTVSAASPPSNETLTSKGEGDGTSKATTIIAVVVPVIAILIIIGLVILLIQFRKHRNRKAEGVESIDDEITTADTLQQDFGTIKAATDDFSSHNKLGEGGFGCVYKGKLPNGLEIAVKRLSAGSGQGDVEFRNEVLLVAKLQHRNLVRLLGFCLEGSERLLVYEFVSNGSLDSFIFDPLKQEVLDWGKRFKIIGGIARGLVYLHEDSRLRVVHRDLKASNILLDENMNPKIADFGMARLFDMNQTQGATSRIVGTYGYMAPEYIVHGQITFKIDVFSFGVLILEIITGKKNSSFRSNENIDDLLSYVWRKWREGESLDIVDRNLTNSSKSEIIRCIHIALLCVQQNATQRPSMASILLMLNSFSTTLPMPFQPAFMSNPVQSNSSSYGHNSLTTTTASDSDRMDVAFTRNDASITELYPR